MVTHQKFLNLIDQFKLDAGVESDGALSARMFDDGKKIAALRAGGDITLRRLITGLNWLSCNWPEDKPKPDILSKNEEATA